MRRTVFLDACNALGTQTHETGYKATTTQGEACMLRSGVKDIRTAGDKDMRQHGAPRSWLATTPGTQTRKTGYRATTTQDEACKLRSGSKATRTTVDRAQGDTAGLTYVYPHHLKASCKC
jgi:hypothetical protein